jgi:predicted PurR-regulated permease PerM
VAAERDTRPAAPGPADADDDDADAHDDSSTDVLPLDAGATLTVDLDWRTVVVALVSLAALGALFQAVVVASAAITLIVVALFVALALDPVVGVLERRRLPRGWSTVAVVLTATLAFAAFVALAGPSLVRESASLQRQLPRTVASMRDIPLLGPRLQEWKVPRKASELLASLPEKLSKENADLGSVVQGVGFGVGAAVLGFLVMVGALFEGPWLVSSVADAIPARRRDGARDVGRIVYRVVARYFAGSLLIALLNGIWVSTVALLAGVPLSPVLGVWAALTSLIPQIGGLLGFAVVLLVSLTAGLLPTLVMAVAFLFFMLLTNHVLQPTIVGRAVRLSAPVTMLAAIGGFSVAGIVGALFAVPTIGAIKAVVEHVRGTEPPEVDPAAHGLWKWWARVKGRVSRSG